MFSRKKSAAYVSQAAVIAALYTAATIAQQLIAPGSASLTVQLRLAEVMNLLCIFMPAAIPGLCIGCFLSNILSFSAIPVDIVFGTAATFLSCIFVRLTGNIRYKGLPVLSAFMPAIFNGIIIGLELEIFYVEGEFELTGFLLQAGSVAAGELAVCLVLGLPLFKSIRGRLPD